MDREAMKQPEALRLADNLGKQWTLLSDQVKAATELRRLHEALETQQEPVAWLSEGGDVSRSKRYMDEMGFKCNPLYTAPKQWVGLTDEEHDSIKHNYHNMTWTLEMFARAIEQALKEKNHG